MEDMLDVENKRMAESLASKVTRLKSVSCWCCGEGKAVIAVVLLRGLTSNTNVLTAFSYVLTALGEPCGHAMAWLVPVGGNSESLVHHLLAALLEGALYV